MDSHYNFSVQISYINKDYNGYNSHECRYLKFYSHDLLKNEEINIFNKSIPCAQEYHDITLNFTAPSNTIMQIPDLNDYDIEGMRIKELSNGTYLHYYPSNSKIILFSNKNNIQTVPLSSDIYTVIVKNNKNEYYYAYFRIVSKELKPYEWRKMVDDLAQISRSMITENVHQFHHHLNLDGFEQADILFQPLINDYQKIMNYIHLILLSPRYKISKRYNWVKLGQEKDIDQITIKKMNEIPNTNGSIYVPHRYINYDIEDNRWIKFIIIQILKRTNLAIKHYRLIKENNKKSFENKKNHHYYNNNNSEIHYYVYHYKRVKTVIDDNLNKLLKLRGYLIYTLNNSMLSQLHRIKGFVPKGLILSAKYNALYRLYINLRNNNIDKDMIHQQIEQYRYKSNSELYELWTFVQVIKALEYKNRFIGIKGWIFDNHLIMPPLKHGQKIFMKSTNDNINLVVVYNKSIPTNTTRNDYIKFNGNYDPICVGANVRHNKPDIRIDIFKGKKQFLGSIILDAKYMKLYNILRIKRKGSVYNQLTEYSRLIVTNPKFPMNIPAVPRVYALYPSQYHARLSQNYKSYLGYSIYLSHLRPGSKGDFINFSNDINTQIDKRVQGIQKFI